MTAQTLQIDEYTRVELFVRVVQAFVMEFISLNRMVFADIDFAAGSQILKLKAAALTCCTALNMRPDPEQFPWAT